jgi:hypothetical protein
MANKDLNKEYNQFIAVDNICEKIVDYLFVNCEDFWKLLYYKTKQPLLENNLTNTQKSEMICKDPSIDGVFATKNILFQMDTGEAIEIAIPQVRLRIGNQIAIDSYRGYALLEVQIIVPNKLLTIMTNDSRIADRAVQITRELTNAINGKVIDGIVATSPFFMNKYAPDGAGRDTGWYRQDNQNKNYSGYFGIFSILL